MEVAGKEDENWLTKPRTEDRSKFPYRIASDNVKWLMRIGKVFLDSMGCWPDHQNKATAFVNFFSIFSVTAMAVAQTAYALDKDTDLPKAADALTGIMFAVEAAARRILGMILAKRFSKIISIILYDFWRSDIAGVEMHKEINRGSWVVVGFMMLQSCQAIGYGFQCGGIPLQYHLQPQRSKFWFPYMQSPYYEVIYIWEYYLSAEMCCIIVGFDFFLVSLVWCCVAQFKLLKQYLLVNFEKVVKRDRAALKGQRSEAMKLILLIFRRHNNLINTCKEIESMLTVYILLLYVGTVGTIVLSGFVGTVVKDAAGRAKMFPYFLGHMIQIFIYCAVGNELIIESTALTGAVAHCGWHLLSYDRDLQKSLILLMVRSQRPITITVGGFGVLSLTSFLKFCFSVYTLLNSMIRRQEAAAAEQL